MIIVKLAGGLGNQMFQYAAGRQLADAHKTELKLDPSFLKRSRHPNTRREYELKHLNISAAVATTADIARVTGVDSRARINILTRLLRKVGLVKPNPNIIPEKHFHFDEAILEAKDNIYLDGYWQSEKYFKNIENILRKEFTVRAPLEGENLGLAEKIISTVSVSVHVRRGDYAANTVISRYHGGCGLDYYINGIDQLRELVPNPHLFIFSDEPNWVESNINLNVPTTIVKHNDPRKGYEDLRLMSLCRHNVIANSSFSWWGAWLNSNPDKIVIAPKKWFNTPDLNTKDLIPEGWKRV